MPSSRLSSPRLAAAVLVVLALHLLLLHGVHDVLTGLRRAAPSPPPPAVRVLALAPQRSVLDAPAAVAAPPPAVPVQKPARVMAEATLRSAVRDERPPSPAVAVPLGVAVAEAESVAPAGELPIYSTQLPPAFAFSYALRRGAQSGQAELHWQPQGEHYRARLTGTGAAGPLLAWESVGAFDAAGLAPARYTDRRDGRGTQAANFQRDTAKVTFSGPSVERALPAGAQDRLSWMLQLAAIAAADPSRVGPRGRVLFLVVGARGDADVWTFGHVGNESLDLPEGGAVATVRLLREPRRPYDTRAEVWLDPARSYLPVRARLSHGVGDEGLQLLLREVLPSP